MRYSSKTSLLALLIIVSIFLLWHSATKDINERFSFLTNPQLDRNDEIYIRTANDEYVSVCNGCEPIDQNLTNKCTKSLCLVLEPNRGSVFTYEPHNDGTFSLKTLTGHYLKRCANCFERCPNVICADGINPKLQEAKFVLIKHGNNGISIKADTGRLLEINECGQSCGRVLAALGVGVNSEFRIEKLPPPYNPPQRQRKQTKKFLVPSYAPIMIPYNK